MTKKQPFSGLSFEFFPARTEKSIEALNNTYSALKNFSPEFFSVTFGAGGSTQNGTHDAVKHMIAQGSNAAPHISCVGASKQNIIEMIDGYLTIDVNRLVVLRGDLPSGMVERGDFNFASELVSFIREQYGDDLHLEVAVYPDFHPESSTPEKDILHFKNKVSCGANSAITQYFYNADSYFAYVDQAQKLGVDIPIIPGIMPITNFSTLVRFSDNCGAEIPLWIRRRLEQYQDDPEALYKFGLDVVTNLCNSLLAQDVPGLHFYTLNKVEPIRTLCQALEINT